MAIGRQQVELDLHGQVAACMSDKKVGSSDPPPRNVGRQPGAEDDAALTLDRRHGGRSLVAGFDLTDVDELVGCRVEDLADGEPLMLGAGIDAALERGGSVGRAGDLVVDPTLELHWAPQGGVGVEHRSAVGRLLVHAAMLRSADTLGARPCSAVSVSAMWWW